jgi:RNA polymerase sigma-70 factor, ECF subfamily
MARLTEGARTVKKWLLRETYRIAQLAPTMTDLHSDFLRLFTAHELAIRAHVRRLVPTRYDADDVMQEVAVVLWQKFEVFRPDGDFRSWAFGVVRYEVLAWRRDKARDRLMLRGDLIELLAVEALEDESRLARQRDLLTKCLDSLEPRQRDLLLAAYQPTTTIQDVARDSGRTIGGFYQWIHRMKRFLLECVRERMKRLEGPRGEPA